MISQDDIEYLKESASIEQVIRSCGVELKRQGSSLVACCPFHGEKTPSFHVNAGKNYYKCFGCGEFGNPIDFVMKYRRLSFVESVREVARMTDYTLTEEHGEQSEESRKRHEKRQQLLDVNKMAMQYFIDCLKKHPKANEYAHSRWSEETIENWCIGYAPDDFEALYDYLSKQKVKAETMIDSGLVRRSNTGKIYSYWRGRLIFPIFNQYHEPIAFCGRKFGNIATDNSDAKYKNSADSELYTKSDVLYGWNFARQKASSTNEVILVEGNPDVIKMHQIGVTNVAASCGTALTSQQVKLVQRTVGDVVLMYDSDAAGQKATEHSGEKVMKEGLNAYVLTIPCDENGEKQDPDTYFDSKEKFEAFYKDKKTPFVLWLAEKHKDECEDPTTAASMMAHIAKMLNGKPTFELTGFIVRLSKIFGTKAQWTAAMKEADKATQKEQRLNESGFTKEQQEMADEYGFFAQNGCYKIVKGEMSYTEVSNFVMEPLFHIESSVAAKRLYRITNRHGVQRDLEIAQKDMVSRTAFCNCVESRGNFLFTGNDADMAKIKSWLYENTKTCTEIEQLGWQRDGFWAWGNGIVTRDGAWFPVDELGTVAFGGQNYYIPACSSTTAQDAQFWQFERRFVYRESDANLLIWAEKMVLTYGDNGKIGICYAVASLFRDLAVDKFRSFPVLNVFGQKGSGKTKFIMSLLRLLGDAEEGPDVSTSTIAAIGDHMSKLSNGFVHLDEYKNNIDPKVIALLKGAYDSRGRMKMDMDGSKKRTTTPVDCGLILSGQEMTTADNALFSRVIYLTFSTSKFTDEQREIFEDLKDYERRSLTPITNMIISKRGVVEHGFMESYRQTKEDMKSELDTSKIDGRIVENWTIVLSIVRTLESEIQLPFKYATLLPLFATYMERQNSAVSDTNEVSNFWRGMETLLVQGVLEIGYDFKIFYAKSNLKLMKGTGKARFEWTPTKPMDVLYVNPSRVFVEYAKMNKNTKSSGTNIVPEETLKYYLSTQDEYMGDISTTFKIPTSKRENPGEGKQYEGGMMVAAPTKTCRGVLVFNYAKLKDIYGIDFEIKSSGVESEEGDDDIPF